MLHVLRRPLSHAYLSISDNWHKAPARRSPPCLCSFVFACYVSNKNYSSINNQHGPGAVGVVDTVLYAQIYAAADAALRVLCAVQLCGHW